VPSANASDRPLVPDGDHDAGRLAALHNRDDLIWFRLSEIRVQEFIAPVLGSFQDGCTPFLGPVHDPVLELLGDIPQHIPAHGVLLPIGVEEANHPLRLLERLDQSVQQDSVEAAVTEANAIGPEHSPCPCLSNDKQRPRRRPWSMMLVKGVHGDLQESDTWSIAP